MERIAEAKVEKQYDPAAELVDVLDEDGVIVGTATRREIRQRRLPHRCTYILLFNPAGELLIHQRTETKDVFPGYWDVAIGGVLAAGEDWETGTRRESIEEIGVVPELEFLFDFRYRGDFGLAFAKVYRGIHGGPFRLQPEEVVRAEFVPTHAVVKLFQERCFCPDGVEVWNLYSQSRRERPGAATEMSGGKS
jgi:isopentenyldiphosphate isomerase